MSSLNKTQHVTYSCPSCPVDSDTPGSCDVCGRILERRAVRVVTYGRARGGRQDLHPLNQPAPPRPKGLKSALRGAT